MNDFKSRSATGGPSCLVTLALLVLSMTMANPCVAQHAATLFLKNGGQTQGVVRYLAASRSFEIRAGNITQTERASNVDRVELAQQPAGLQQAVSAVNSGNYQSVPLLSQIMSSYTMLGPDVVAGQALALAYLRTNRTRDALKVCEDLLRANPDLLNAGGFASVYWEVLLAEDRISTLRISLRTAIETGSREVAAVAQVRRGDLEMQKQNPSGALLDGYLRTILLFRDVTFIQPEALYKAIKAHEALNEVQYAERWRKRLLGSFGTSDFAAKIK